MATYSTSHSRAYPITVPTISRVELRCRLTPGRELLYAAPVPRHITDDYHTHKHADIPAWLAKHPRVTLHFTPNSDSWLNLFEVFFGIITRQAIRRSSFDSVPQLVAAIRTFIDGWNERSHPFTWTKTADEILPRAIRRSDFGRGDTSPVREGAHHESNRSSSARARTSRPAPRSGSCRCAAKARDDPSPEHRLRRREIRPTAGPVNASHARGSAYFREDSAARVSGHVVHGRECPMHVGTGGQRCRRRPPISAKGPSGT